MKSSWIEYGLLMLIDMKLQVPGELSILSDGGHKNTSLDMAISPMTSFRVKVIQDLLSHLKVKSSIKRQIS